MLNRKEFYSTVRKFAGGLDQSQVDGFEAILNAVEAAKVDNLAWVAYMLATAWHETNKTMKPVKEAYWLSEDWRKKNLRYYPYYGRGYVQLTWKSNYEKYGIADDLDKALDPDVAARIMIHGMINGVFTGRKLSDYDFSRDKDWREARRIINGTDKAKQIADYGQAFYKALKAGLG